MATDSDEEDVAAVLACLRDAVQRKDVAVVLSLMTEDVVYLPPLGAGPPLVGIDTVRAALIAEPRFGWLKYDYGVDRAFGEVRIEVLSDVAMVPATTHVSSRRAATAFRLSRWRAGSSMSSGGGSTAGGSPDQ
jgi:ketosteroid isomerase-like protein